MFFFYSEYIIYIIYSFLTLFCMYIGLELYKKYSFKIFKMFKKSNDEIITSEKYSTRKKNTVKKVKKIKNHYKIKSTEKTYEDIKFISNKPNYISVANTNNMKHNEIFNLENLNCSDDLEKKFCSNKIKNYDKIKKIACVYLKTKQEFYNTYINSETGEYFINNLKDFEEFYKNALDKLNKSNNTNILMLFYNDNENTQYIYINKNKMIKILYSEEYENIANMIEKNNGPFMLEDVNNNYIMCYGGYVCTQLNLNDIKKVFFSNISNYSTNKNYLLLKEFKFIKIYFYTCNQFEM